MTRSARQIGWMAGLLLAAHVSAAPIFAAEKPPEDGARVVYVIEKRGHPYHVKDCSQIKGIKSKVYGISLKAAKAGGRKPCKTCRP